MSAALTILLLTVAGPDAGDPFTPAIARATREALGSETQVVLRALPNLPNDADAAALAVELHADAVVELSWSVPDHLRASIHLKRLASGRWVDREIGFRPIDDPAERGRTVAFLVVSMLPERLPASTERATPAETRPPVDTIPPPSAAMPSGFNPVVTLAGTAIAALGVGDHGGGAGGAVDLRARLGAGFALRLGAGARVGLNPPDQTGTRFYSGSAGFAWSAWTARNTQTVLGIRWDALLVRADFAHASTDQIGTEHRGKWMPGADLLVEATYFFTQRAAIVAGAGAEAAFGKTDVFVGGQRLDTLRPLRPVLELGLRASF